MIRRRAPLSLAVPIVLALSGCQAEERVHPAALVAPSVPPVRAIDPPRPEAPAPRPPPPAAPEFCTTESSDEWVDRTFHVQARPARVLVVVHARAAAPRTVRTRVIRLNARGAPARDAGEDRAPDGVFHTLQAAADAARGGDLVAVMPGRYVGFSVGDKPDAGDDRYLHFEAMGRPGEVIIDRPCARDPRWMILIEAAHHVIVEGFNVAGAERPGDTSAKGPWAGIMLDGDFGRSSKEVHHVAILANFSHNHANWGLHSTDTHTVLIQDNVFAASAKEHSAYISDGSDNYVIRRNVFFGSYASGLQVNLDPEASLAEVAKHPAFRGRPGMKPNRAWAEGLLAAATERFGENNFPDGRGVNFIIEDNVINENGRLGGGALNLAGVQRSLVQNNLIYGNYNHGIAQWDNANPFDAAAVSDPPETPDAVTGVRLPIWGCRDNLIRNNTVILSDPARAAMQCHHGSFGTRLYNNVFINDTGPSIQVDATSIAGLDARANVLGAFTDDGTPSALLPLAKALPNPGRDTLGATRASLSREVVRAGAEPWLILERGYYRLNPKRPDFRPRRGSALLAGRGDARETPPHDLTGKARATPDIGALAE